LAFACHSLSPRSATGTSELALFLKKFDSLVGAVNEDFTILSVGKFHRYQLLREPGGFRGEVDESLFQEFTSIRVAGHPDGGAPANNVWKRAPAKFGETSKTRICPAA
jgi:hypothetical protein